MPDPVLPMPRAPQPPRLAAWLFRQCLHEVDVDQVLGDLDETFGYLAEGYSPREARRWYWSQVLRSLPSFFYRACFWGTVMLKNYLTTALRNLRRHKGYAFINVTGLAVGLACCLLILLFVQHELSYDQYHADGDRLFRVSTLGRMAGNELDLALGPAPLGPTMVADLPEVEQMARFRRYGSAFLCRETTCFEETGLYYADSTVFDVLTLPLLHGDPQTALTQPKSLVLTETVAEKYFGAANPVGQPLQLDDEAYTVSGVLADLPDNTHLQFPLLVAMVDREESRSPLWFNANFNTYVRVAPGMTAAALEEKLRGLLQQYGEPQVQQYLNLSLAEFEAQGNAWRFIADPLPDIHLRGNRDGNMAPGGNLAYVYIFSAVALFILLLACINFTNLSTARSATRAKEVGVRKALGSSRTQLIRQFLSESLLMSGLGLGLALGLVALLLPLFNQLAGQTLHFGVLLQPAVLLALVGFGLGVGLLAGLYPAFYLSSFQPVSVLKGRIRQGFRASALRRVLVVLQFAISIVLLIGTGVVYQQLQFVQEKQLGFDREHLLVVRHVGETGTQMRAFKDQVLAHPQVVEASLVGSAPGQNHDSNGLLPEGAGPGEVHVVFTNVVDADYIHTMDMHVLDGRPFDDARADSHRVLINEAAARYFGWEPAQAVGKIIRTVGDEPTHQLDTEVVGLVADFNFQSLHTAVEPMVMWYAPPRTNRTFQGNRFHQMIVRLRGENIAATVSALENTWATFVADRPLDYTFLDAQFDALYRAEQRTGRLFVVFSVLAVLIACLGLFGLASFATEQRLKEIGVRKVLGASVPGLVGLLSQEFTKLVLVAFALAAPIAYFLMDQWLADFAYQTAMPWWLFAAAGLGALFIAFATVSYRALQAARANPVTILRHE